MIKIALIVLFLVLCVQAQDSQIDHRSPDNNVGPHQEQENQKRDDYKFYFHPQATAFLEEKVVKNGPFFGAFLANVFSEFGDKTFLIAAVMATKYSRLSVFIGSTGALTFMSLISCLLGHYIPSLLSPTYTSIIAGVLLTVFGGMLLWDAYKNEHDEEEEKELEQELQEMTRKLSHHSQQKPLLNDEEIDGQKQQIQEQKDQTQIQNQNAGDTNNGDDNAENKKFFTKQNLIVMGAVFSQVFFGEWGDKSQLTTIALAADNNSTLVFLGASLGLALCNFFAVLGGKLLAEKVSERILNICGGILMFIFAISSFAKAFQE